MAETKDYYPSVNSRLQTVLTQIEEFEKIVFRNDLELRIATAVGDNVTSMTKEVTFNNEIAMKKLDEYYAIRDELQKELGIEA